ncbi:MAG: RNA 2',3'-cyclic phosphodiesterase [Candidatus Paceibacterota bacterium]|jgi:2'-5' RNA ligase|nr:RNA 2',3'-cyclic phosphodiesterase [Candidatus Paceibacterota bacterium]MDD5555209.1 RNA 2',3'-cyclic phosphodiesterase [Candidatus Paceibacterota bacterium]
MKKRVFIAVNLPQNVKEKLEAIQKKTDSSFSFFNDFCPIKWTRKNSLHITLLFLGNMEMEDVFYAFEKTGELAQKTAPFEIVLNGISYSPPDNPRLVWVNGEKSEELKEAHDFLEKELSGRGSKEFAPHITLGRIKQWQFRKIDKEEIPRLEEINLRFKVNSIEVMESELKKGGAAYTVLKSFSLES